MGVPIVAQQLTNLTSFHEDAGLIPGLSHCCELWCRSQTWLRSWVAVAVASSWVPIRTPAWEPPHDVGVALRRPKKKKFAVMEFLVAELVNHMALSLQQLGLLLWHGFYPWLWNFHMPRVQQKTKKKKTCPMSKPNCSSWIRLNSLPCF